MGITLPSIRDETCLNADVGSDFLISTTFKTDVHAELNSVSSFDLLATECKTNNFAIGDIIFKARLWQLIAAVNTH